MEIFQFIYDWFTVDVYNFVQEGVEYVLLKLIWMRIKFIIWIYGTAWSVAATLIADLRIVANWHLALSFIPPQMKSTLEFFNIFTGLSWTFNALATRFVMRFIKVN